ncbi:DUF2273 domain-containing protein [Caldicellulosiruptor morganii]|uniref:DUF2273 domain-containing protein n=1 Tax=Caldicellulosiruptor morganii TaxID=1387555 RepID=A0ABY7BK45_9FIRM|nr:DUF2273 domain-containing protein [Caldicellulosiruptor morganii]WAM33207.1 DUF2273 domain-containing protein [Caldicellulosiruptor morganii]
MNKFDDFLYSNFGKIIGGVIALIIVLLIFEIGILKTVILLLAVGVGVFLGKKYIKAEKFKDFFK